MKNKLFRTALSLTVAVLLVLALLPRPAYAAGASLSGSSSVQAGNSVTLTLSVNSKIYGLTADLNCGSNLTFTNYTCSVSGWSILVNQNHFSVYGTSSASGAVITVTLKVSSGTLSDTALSASFDNIVASDGDSDIDMGSATWSGTVAAAPSDNCSLSAIIAGNFTLNPAFSPNTTYYTAKVPYSVEKLNLDYNRADKTQSVSISGTQLAVGLNTVTLKVTAANGATRTYTIEVTREQDPNYKPSSDATLSQLGIEGAALSPAFSSSVRDYIAYVPFETTTVKLSAAANDSKASGVSGTGDVTIDKDGDNLVTVTCTAEDKTTKEAYTIHVVRMPQYTGIVPTVTVTEPDPEPAPDPEPEVPMLEIPLNVKLPLLGEVRTSVAIIGGMVLVAGLLFLLGLFIGRSTGGNDDDGPDDPPARDDRRSEPLQKTNVKTLPYPGFPTDMQPQIAAVLSLAQGTSLVTEGVYGANRFKYVDELKRMGAHIQVDGKVAVIEGASQLVGAPIQACDLRAGAALVIAGLAAKGTTELSCVQYIERGYEDLVGKLRAVGADIAMVDVPEESEVESHIS